MVIADPIRLNRPTTLDVLFTAGGAYCTTLVDGYDMPAGLLLAARR